MKIDEKSFNKMCEGCERCDMNEYNYNEIRGAFDKGVFYPNYCPMKNTKTRFPKEAWYDGRKAKKIVDDIYYVWRGEWSDPIYIVVTERHNDGVFGQFIDGIEVNYQDVWGNFEEGEKPSTEELMEVIYDYSAVPF